MFRYWSLGPDLPVILARLAELDTSTLALMPGSSFSGNGRNALCELADAYGPDGRHAPGAARAPG